MINETVQIDDFQINLEDKYYSIDTSVTIQDDQIVDVEILKLFEEYDHPVHEWREVDMRGTSVQDIANMLMKSSIFEHEVFKYLF